MSAEFEEIDAGDVVWRFDRDFLESRWTCIWGRGCLGILDEPAEHLGQGCCSIGAELGDTDEAMTDLRVGRDAAAGALRAPCRGPCGRHLPRRRPSAHACARERMHLPQRSRLRGWRWMCTASRRARRGRAAARLEAFGVLAAADQGRLGAASRWRRDRDGAALDACRLGRRGRDDGVVLHRGRSGVRRRIVP